MTPTGQQDSAWQPDLLDGYEQLTLPLGLDPNGEGELAATLVRMSPEECRKRSDVAPSGVRHAVLMVHGYTDYFFNTEPADFFARRGFAVYGIDLHKCGRSHRAGQTPHFVTDLAAYDIELELALEQIAADAPGTRVLVCGHSAGGLIVTLWLDRVRRRGATAAMGVGGLVLNSPFFDLMGPPLLRTVLVSATLATMSRIQKWRVVRGTGMGAYGLSLHRDYGGDFDYNLLWKPLGGFPVTFGWIAAVRAGHARLHRGLDVGVPNLILRSDHSIPESTNTAVMQRGDAVLDVRQIARWAGCVGGTGTTIVPVVDAKHDVFLSLPAPRAATYAALGAWLDRYVEQTQTGVDVEMSS